MRFLKTPIAVAPPPAPADPNPLSRLIEIHSLVALVLRCCALVLLQNPAPPEPELQELFAICQQAQRPAEAGQEEALRGAQDAAAADQKAEGEKAQPLSMISTPKKDAHDSD
jgi:hypothetical protein